MTATTTTTITIPIELYNDIRELAAASEQSENELLAEALRAYKRQEMRMQFRSIDVISDDEVTGANSEDWLRDNCNPDERG